MTSQEMHFEVTSDPRLLCCLRALVRTYMGVLGYNVERTEEVVLALDEACTNAIRHSYGGRPDQRLELDFRVCDEYTEITLRDSGAPAPKAKLARRNLEADSPEAVRPGGLGVQIIHRVFDDVVFEPGETQGNTVTMRLKRAPRTQGGV